MPAPLESTYIIEEAFRTGLRQSRRNAINRQRLTRCYNLRTSEDGLVPHDVIPFTSIAVPAELLGSAEGGLSNGNFASALTGWTISAGSWSGASGALVPTAITAQIFQAVTGLTAGRQYRVSFDYVAGASVSGQSRIVILTDSTGVQFIINFTESGSYQFSFTAGTTNQLFVDFHVFGSASGFSFDNFVIKEIINSQVDWPYPQLMKGKVETWLGAKTKLYLVDESNGTSTAVPDSTPSITDIGIYDAYDLATAPVSAPLATSGIGPWQFADFGKNWFMCNGVNLVTRLAMNGDVTAGIKIAHLSNIKVGSIGKYRGRLFMGGFTTNPDDNPNLILGGTFASDGGYWTLINCSITGGVIDFTGSSTGAAVSTPTQFVPTEGKTYEITYTVVGRSAGTVTVSIGGTAGTTRSSDDTFVESIVAGASGVITFSAASSFDGNIDNIIITDTTTYFTSNEWLGLFNSWLEYSRYEIYTHEDITFDRNWIFYSRVNGGDVHWPFTQEMAMLGVPNIEEYNILKPLIQDGLENGELGFIQMPWEGDIFAMKELGDALVVYGENGVTALRWNAQADMFDLVSVFSKGIKGRASVNGDHRRHLFVDKAGELWHIGEDLRPQRLEYGEYLKPLTDSDDEVVISYDHVKEYFYIATSTVGFVLNESGLTEISSFPTNLAFADGEMIGFMINQTGAQDFDVKTDIYDLDYRGIKTIHNIHLACDNAEDLFIQVECKVDTTLGSDWLVFDAQEINERGIVTPIATGTQFRIRIYGKITDGLRLSKMYIKWRAGDKQGARGVIANQPS